MATRKVSLSLPVELVEEARRWLHGGSLSAYVADGLRRRILADRQCQYLAELDDEFGPVSEADLKEARRIWRDEA